MLDPADLAARVAKRVEQQEVFRRQRAANRARRRAERLERQVAELPPYSDEMKARARAWIAEREANEDPDLVFRRYVEVCMSAFLRRLKRLQANDSMNEPP